jgi:hypothetical protein
MLHDAWAGERQFEQWRSRACMGDYVLLRSGALVDLLLVAIV